MNKSKSPCSRKCIHKEECKREKGEKSFKTDSEIMIYCDKYEKEPDKKD